MRASPVSGIAQALLLSTTALTAQTTVVHWPDQSIGYASKHWDTRSGLPQNTIADLLPSSDGGLLIATLGGLCAYDGDTLAMLPSDTVGLTSNRFLCLCRAPDGALLIGTDNHGILSQSGKQDGFGPCMPDRRFPATSIYAMAIDDRGRLLAATYTGLLRSNGDGSEDLWPAGSSRPRGLVRTAAAGLLALSSSGVFAVGERVRLLEPCEATALCEYAGRIIVGTQRGLFLLGRDGREPLQPIGQLEQPITALLAATDGALWVGTQMCLIRIDGVGMRDVRPIAADPTRLTKVLPVELAATVHVLHEDAAGGIWVGYERAGLTRLSPAEVLCHGVASGLPHHELNCVLPDGSDSLLVGTNRGLLRGRDGRYEFVGDTHHLRIRALARDANGTIWFASEEGLYRLTPAGPELALATAALPRGRPRAMVGDPEAGLWLGCDGGLTRVVGDQASVPAAVAAAPPEAMRRLVRAPDGAIWWGSAASLGRLSPDRATVKTWRCGDVMPNGEVRGILPEVGEHAWVASYGAGIVRIDDDRCTTVGEREGLSSTALCELLPCGEHLLAATNSGLLLVHRTALAAVVAGTARTLACRPLRTADGALDECSGGLQPCATTFDGRYWVCGLDGLLEFDPARLHPLRGHPTVHLEGLVIGERAWPVQRDVVAPEPVRSATFLIDTTSLDHHDQIRYRWRMRGHTPTWSEPTFRREVHFDDLPPGDLVFEAEAIGIDGSTSVEPLHVRLHVPAPWWQALWVRIAAPIAGIALSYLLLRTYAARAARRAAQLQRLVDERTRELTVAQEQLEHRVEGRTGELKAALQRQQLEMVERQRLERELQQLRRMESIGQFAGGIAHDFNNLLTITSGAGEMLGDEVLSADGRELCRNIQQACERGRGLTQHLLAVASRQVVAVSTIDLAAVVRDLLPVLRRLLGEDIELRFLDADGPTPVRGATTQIEQILLNLAANARDAMPRGGTLSIRLWRAEHLVHCAIQDTGEGMSQAVVEHAFEPFFTTKKAQGLGRGLGLATVYGITKQLGGDVAIDSALGQGTTVQVTLPLLDQTGPPPHAEPVDSVAGALDLRVLLIEDEPDVRRVLQRVLERIGCPVVPAGSGDEAVALLAASPDAFDVVVSDVVMPGLQGLALVEAIRNVASDLPIVFLSGYLEGRLTHRDLLDAGLDILPKPVDTQKLAAVLRRRAGARGRS